VFLGRLEFSVYPPKAHRVRAADPLGMAEIFSSGETPWENYHRFRYAAHLGFRLWDDPRWSQRFRFKQYFLDSPSDNERFPTERDYNLTFTYMLPNSHQMSFGFEVESYFFSQLQNDGHAYLLIPGYRL
jgi:hypothetical protein